VVDADDMYISTNTFVADKVPPEEVSTNLSVVPVKEFIFKVFAVTDCVNIVFPVTVPPLKGKKLPLTVLVVPVVNPVTLKVPPVLFVKVAVPFEYVPPVTLTSVGRF
jgi:hypothetical protein